jgi:flagellar L-ring protein precursor FlgH
MRSLAAATLSVFVLAGCADIPGITPTPPSLPLPPPSPSEVYQPSEGSLWQGDASRRFLAFENRARRIGDLLTVQIVEEATAESEASTELDRNSDFEATLNSGISLQNIVARPIINILRFFGFTDQRTTSEPSGELNIVDAETTTKFEGEGTSDREATFTTTIACLVTDVSGAGLLRIEGERQLRINNETQIIHLSGFVRPEDINLDNTIASTQVASADIQYTGVGMVSEQQRAPWLMRLFELVLPF